MDDKNGPAKSHDSFTTLKKLLFIYAEEGKTTEVQSILDNYPELVNQKNNLGFSLLSVAVKRNFLDLSAYLISKGSEINLSNNRQQSILSSAVANNNIELAELLLTSGANINYADNRGWTPLMVASNLGDLEMVRLLLRYNPDLSIIDKFGKKAYDRAKNSDIALLIQNHQVSQSLSSNQSALDFIRGRDYARHSNASPLILQKLETNFNLPDNKKEDKNLNVKNSNSNKGIKELTQKDKIELISSERKKTKSQISTKLPLDHCSLNSQQTSEGNPLEKLMAKFIKGTEGKLKESISLQILDQLKKQLDINDSSVSNHFVNAFKMESSNAFTYILNMFNKKLAILLKKHKIPDPNSFLLNQNEIEKEIVNMNPYFQHKINSESIVNRLEKKNQFIFKDKNDHSSPTKGLDRDISNMIVRQMDSLSQNLAIFLREKVEEAITITIKHLKELVSQELRKGFISISQDYEKRIDSMIRSKFVSIFNRLKKEKIQSSLERQKEEMQKEKEEIEKQNLIRRQMNAVSVIQTQKDYEKISTQEMFKPTVQRMNENSEIQHQEEMKQNPEVSRQMIKKSQTTEYSRSSISKYPEENWRSSFNYDNLQKSDVKIPVLSLIGSPKLNNPLSKIENVPTKSTPKPFQIKEETDKQDSKLHFDQIPKTNSDSKSKKKVDFEYEDDEIIDLKNGHNYENDYDNLEEKNEDKDDENAKEKKKEDYFRDIPIDAYKDFNFKNFRNDQMDYDDNQDNEDEEYIIGDRTY